MYENQIEICSRCVSTKTKTLKVRRKTGEQWDRLFMSELK
jgi:hypothetical protein